MKSEFKRDLAQSQKTYGHSFIWQASSEIYCVLDIGSGTEEKIIR